MIKEYPYQKQWEEYRRLRNRQYIVFISGFILNFTNYFGSLSGLGSGSISITGLSLTIIWAVLLFYVVLRFHIWKCPACGERFFRRTFWITMPELLSNCRNCNLPKYEGSSFKK